MKKPSGERKKAYQGKDTLLLYAILFLLIFGVVMVYDVSVVYAYDIFGGKYYFLYLQAVWVLLGLAGFFIGYRIDYHSISKVALPLFVVSLISLIFVLIPSPFAPLIYGARRWIYLNPSPFPTIPIIGRIGFQPSELIKLSFIFYLSVIFSKREVKALLIFIPVCILLVGLVLAQPDFGTAMLISIIGLIMLLVSGLNFSYFLVGVPIALAFASVFILSSAYRKERFLTYLGFNSEDTEGTSYHINQILIALGSGGLFGLGFGQSRQKYQYIPEVATDSIFAVIGEELGFIGLVFLVSLFLFIIIRGYRIALKAPDKLGTLLATGVTSWFAVQSIVNLSGMVNLLPLTGVPLPLISYGGSSMVFGLCGLGVLLNVSRSCQNI
ncbi:hypothetical protein A2716_03420 [candidate division WWE3 bacterium RIFCSPHIGHO2_01_FULL_40_23]|uniref:Probable peptidoglycan glycosyltransferase FtsW n=1 Tax=candidate division WWE3 bacterium RIFCSPLOWO2_01_FULL_41_18 TaxID=1802625 RepID=A0A1F4VCS5_UNCKA|nr:MAG: hypothetical protein A2716_03420 [candidate division WWE3 bacterium RIFCSPHIGHO2_01_FULL_40_23]OGC54929.1 MAG: hypothetical protein A3A78_03030 [candidate division WWE3 bacterium RIFCSPLOWO2_01_FULL_41_18]